MLWIEHTLARSLTPRAAHSITQRSAPSRPAPIHHAALLSITQLFCPSQHRAQPRTSHSMHARTAPACPCAPRSSSPFACAASTGRTETGPRADPPPTSAAPPRARISTDMRPNRY
eukprot:1032443-Rhodomonas_salina.1